MKKLFRLSHKRINQMNFGTELKYKLLAVVDENVIIAKKVLVIIKDLELELEEKCG